MFGSRQDRFPIRCGCAEQQRGAKGQPIDDEDDDKVHNHTSCPLLGGSVRIDATCGVSGGGSNTAAECSGN